MKFLKSNFIDLLIYLDCLPYSEEICEKVGYQLNLKFSKGHYDSKGCYTYNDGQHPGEIFFGTYSKDGKWVDGSPEEYTTDLKSPQYRPHGFDCNRTCVPYSETACAAVADVLGLPFSRGKWSTKGCYGYDSGSYKNNIYYSIGGTSEENKANPGSGKHRPSGFDCEFECEPYSLAACKEAGKQLNLKGLTVSNYDTKGCYSYRNGSYAGMLYYGTGGKAASKSSAVKLPKYRPSGYDCK